MNVPLLKRAEIIFKETPWIVSRSISGFTNRASVAFYRKMMSGGYEPDKLIMVLPRHKLIYVAIPKAASTRIRKTLARIEGRFSRSLRPSKRLNYRGPYGPRNMTIGSFHEIAISSATLRFSFVRNPYARILSCWADKFSTKPIVKGDCFIDAYLAIRREIDPRLPHGATNTLSFADFVIYAAAVANARQDSHLQAQCDILQIPGIELDFVGKVESFDIDFTCVLDYLKADSDVCREAAIAANESHHDDWPTYYTPDIADLIYRAYERDFDRFDYPRALVPSIGRNQASTGGSFGHRGKMLRSESPCSTPSVTRTTISTAVRPLD
jgi:hypothetical protein